jgi:hypothetical protein
MRGSPATPALVVFGGLSDVANPPAYAGDETPAQFTPRGGNRPVSRTPETESTVRPLIGTVESGPATADLDLFDATAELPPVVAPAPPPSRSRRRAPRRRRPVIAGAGAVLAGCHRCGRRPPRRHRAERPGAPRRQRLPPQPRPPFGRRRRLRQRNVRFRDGGGAFLAPKGSALLTASTTAADLGRLSRPRSHGSVGPSWGTSWERKAE